MVVEAGKEFELVAMATRCLFLVMIILVCSLSPPFSLGSPSSDVAVLQELLREWKATAGPAVFDNWSLDEDADACTDRWNGVVCSQEKSVIHLLTFEWCKFEWSIPAAIGALDELITLDLSGNPLLSSSIPSEIGDLCHLTHLKLSDCNFSGKVPQEIYNLSELEYLDLSNNPHLLLDQDANHIMRFRRQQNSPTFSHRRSLLQVNGRTPLPIFFTYIALGCVGLVAIIIFTFCFCRWRSVRKTRNDPFLMTPARPIVATNSSLQSRRIFASEDKEAAEQNP